MREVSNAHAPDQCEEKRKMDLKSDSWNVTNATSSEPKVPDLTLNEIAARAAFSTVFTIVVILSTLLALRIVLR